MPRTARARWALLSLILGFASSPLAAFAGPMYKFVDLGLAPPEADRPDIPSPAGWVQPGIVDGPEAGSTYILDAHGDLVSPFPLAHRDPQALDLEDPGIKALLQGADLGVSDYHAVGSVANDAGRAIVYGMGTPAPDGAATARAGSPSTSVFLQTLVDTNTNTYIDLTALAKEHGWSWASFSRIDEEGRLFGWGIKDDGLSGPYNPDEWSKTHHAFLVLPMGFPTPVPEPSTGLIFAALAAGALAARRFRGRVASRRAA